MYIRRFEKQIRVLIVKYYKETKELRNILYKHGRKLIEILSDAKTTNQVAKHAKYLLREDVEYNIRDIWKDVGRFMAKLAAQEGVLLNEIMRENLNQTERNAIQYMFDTIG
jgi:hypothetical protein